MTRALYIVVSLFVVAIAYLLSAVHERQTVLGQVVHHNDAWAISQAVQEVLRLENAIARTLIEDEDDRSQIRLRLDIVFSRLEAMQEGTLHTFLAQMQSHRETASGISAYIESLDGNLEVLSEAQLRQEFLYLDNIVSSISHLPAQAVQQSWVSVEESLGSLKRVHLVFGAVVAVLMMCWCSLLFLLLRHNKLLLLEQDHSRTLNANLSMASQELRDRHDRLEYSAHHDQLTGLPNRVLFWSELEASLQLSSINNVTVSLLLIDLDDFKIVNDTLGHDFGDMLLQQVSNRMLSFGKESQVMCRLGGDEFACVLIGYTPTESIAYANDLSAEIAAPYVITDRRLQIGCSIGIATSEKLTEDNVEVMVKYADIALYGAKASPSERICLFEPYMKAQFESRKELAEDLRGAIFRKEIDVAYQVQVDVKSGQVRGVEALARWTHPVRGSIPAPLFVSIAEEMGMINDLGLLVLTQACSEAKKWTDNIKIAVNISSLQLQSTDVFNVIKDVLTHVDLDPRRLELEITESVLLDRREEVFQALYHLRHFGVSVAMDDFGTGYSSLAVLRDIQFDTIKLDKSFMRDLTSDPVTQTLVKFVGELSSLLGKELIVEGVETAEQYEVVRRLGCVTAQGYLLGRPSPASHLTYLNKGDSELYFGNIA